MVTKIKVSASCWQTICDEFDRVAPREGILVPLVALDLADSDHNPCSNISLEDVVEMVIADVVLIPSDRQRNQLARVSVLGDTDDLVGQRIEESVQRHPRLRACAHLHSHPFARGSTWPSRGSRCDYDGHMLPLLFDNRGAGLDTSFSFIACRKSAGRDDTNDESGRWKLQCFALDGRARIVDLGFAEVVPDAAVEVVAALHPPLHASTVARTWFRHWRRRQRTQGRRVKVEPLFDGWLRAIAQRHGQPTSVVLLPNDLPTRRSQFFVVEGGQSREVFPPDVPAWQSNLSSSTTKRQTAALRNEYFARVEPLLGKGLSRFVVALDNVSLTSRIVELLVGCRLEKLIINDVEGTPAWPMESNRCCAADADESAAAALLRHQLWKNPYAHIEYLPFGKADVTIDGRLATVSEAPHIEWDASQRRVTLVVADGDLFAFRDLSYTIARDLRDILLQKRPWPISHTWIGCEKWPFLQTCKQVEETRREPVTPPVLEGIHLMVVGCGSVGSEAIRLLAGRGARWTLVDNGKVSVFNLLRQWFGFDDVGQVKVDVLTHRLAPEPVRAVPCAYSAKDIGKFADLVDEDPPDAVFLCTGTDDDAGMAEVLWSRGIPHLAAYAYPQARFFEINTIIPDEETPCLHCLRGNLFRGAPSAPRMTSEVERFLYRDLAVPERAEERREAYTNLVAEPASPIETGRIAEVLARCALQSLAPANMRELWFERMLSAKTTCLLGGNVVDIHGGEAAYGISEPGQVIRLGLEDIMGAAESIECQSCGRQLEVHVDISLPTAADDDDMNRALLG